MRVVLRRRIRDHQAPGGAKYEQAVFSIERLTVGRAADQLIQIPDVRLSAAHLQIVRRQSAFCMRALAAPVVVNGLAMRKAALRPGDVLSLADRHLTVEDIRQDGVMVLRLGLPIRDVCEQSPGPEAQTLRDAGLRANFPSWALVIVVSLSTFVSPLLASLPSPMHAQLRDAALLPSDALWSPGPLHTAHQSIGGDCNSCHGSPFARVSNQACAKCHAGTQHHVPVDSPARVSFAARYCADCHVEHGKPTQLIDTNSRFCVTCHQNLRKLDPNVRLQNASDFGRDHPDFSLAMLRPENHGGVPEWRTSFSRAGTSPPPAEESNLKFSHQVHLDSHGIKSPSGDQVLQCSDCHQTDAGGRKMTPVRMETHCARCHSLFFDENDPTTAVPHGALAPIFTALQEHFSGMFLKAEARRKVEPDRRRPGGEQIVMTREEQRRALDWTTRQSMQAARELLEKRVCVECHTVTRDEALSGFEQWRVEPVRLSASWMPRARFNHAAHHGAKCTACHHQAERSDSSSDVLMPGIKDCRSCHGGNNDHARLASDCTMCHRLHIGGRGDYIDAPPQRERQPDVATAAGARRH
jgi:predicted CXXCH cytochrome family protein